ncbi:MAG TPA: hypothetical protein VK435_07135 [Thermodesulfovibrionales bacterium]|nr:hypothetical protein [Thermodesulfovibrionales bacterium]
MEAVKAYEFSGSTGARIRHHQDTSMRLVEASPYEIVVLGLDPGIQTVRLLA